MSLSAGSFVASSVAVPSAETCQPVILNEKDDRQRSLDASPPLLDHTNGSLQFIIIPEHQIA